MQGSEILFCLGIFALIGFVAPQEDLLGCFEQHGNTTKIDNVSGQQGCVDACSRKFFRYASVRENDRCGCVNYLGVEGNCNSTCDTCGFESVYFASKLVVGPPRNFRIANVTDTTIHMSWTEPETFTVIKRYKVMAHSLQSFATFKIMDLDLTFSNNTFRGDFVNLHPSTTYNVTLQGVPTKGQGAVVWRSVTTKIGEPDHIPENPIVLKRDKNRVSLQLNNVTNNNGPITSYLIIVMNRSTIQSFDSSNLKSYKDAIHEGISYYITAEISEEDFSTTFIVGDGKYYGKYYNALLEPNTDYNFILAVKSQSKEENVSYVVYSDNSELKKFKFDQDEDTPTLVIGLSVAIGLLSLLLIGTLVGFLLLRNKILHRNRQRLNDNQELTFQGPMISLENNGYIPDEEVVPANHYENLNEQVWTIPRNLLNIQHTCILGHGKFGMVHSGTVHKESQLKTVAIYSIADGKLEAVDKRAMLKDLDTLIRAEKHENVIELVGTCESLETVCVVLEYVSTNLKELLLGCRNNSPGSFCNISSYQLLDLAVGIAKGMAHLEQRKILHKQLCARNISIINGFTPKVSGFGLAQYYEEKSLPNYTRWTAKEVFRGQQHTVKSDVWSFACLLWEVCALGGTPYGNMANHEIPERVMRNQILRQLQYVGENFYQVMLNCWQIDADERPNFRELTEALTEVKDDTFSPALTLDLYPGFQYEQYFPQLEISAT